jgi:cation diffusion facilitator family transporter
VAKALCSDRMVFGRRLAAPATPAEAEEVVGRRIALLSMSVGAVLAVAKIWVGMNAGSTSVVSDGLEAAGDVLSSGIVYAGLWLASKPPDYEHPYGHGRYETLAGLAIGAMLLLAGAAIFRHNLTSLGQPSRLEAYALYPLIAAVFIKIALAGIKFRVGKRIASTSLEADGWHDITDLLSTCVALVAVILTLASPRRWGAADHIGGLIIGIFIFFLSVQVVRRTIGQLLDTMPEPRKLAQIRAAALAVPGALGIEKCLARRTGLKYHVDLHLEVDPEMTVRESHEIASAVKMRVKEDLPWVADVLVHVEPSSLSEQIETGKTFVRRAHGK